MTVTPDAAFVVPATVASGSVAMAGSSLVGPGYMVATRRETLYRWLHGGYMSPANEKQPRGLRF